MPRRWREALFTPVDGASSAVFRILFGLCVLVGVVRYVAYGWVDLLYLQPTFFFTWPGFDWVVPWPGAWMYVLYGLVGTAGALVALGLFYRPAIVALFLSFTYVELIDKTNYLNHYYFVSLVALLMCFMPLSRTASLDALRRPDRASPTVPTWVVWTLRAQIGVVYLFAGVAKLNADWLLHGEPLRIWLSSKTDFPVVGPWLAEPGVALAMSWGGAIFDLSIFGLLLWRRTRWLAYGLVLFFHAATGLLFNIGMFPLIMIGLTLVFFEPDWPRRLARWLGWTVPDAARPAAAPLPRAARLVPGALALWFAAQVLLPMRHLAYPGDVRWTHEGWRFSWRVLLVESRGFFRYRVVDPATGRQWVVHPEQELHPRQQHLASSSPDMILHYAHHLRDTFAERGHPGVEVYADAWLSMNGRPSVRFVDPDRDLASVPRVGLDRWDWVLPPGSTATASR